MRRRYSQIGGGSPLLAHTSGLCTRTGVSRLLGVFPLAVFKKIRAAGAARADEPGYDTLVIRNSPPEPTPSAVPTACPDQTLSTTS
jgi:hypothetical protein